MWYSGIDRHQRTITLHTLDAKGEVARQVQVPARREVLAAYFASLPGPHPAVGECTGRWYWVRDLLSEQGIDRRLGHATYLKAISYAKVKTDAVDAATLAQLLRAGLIPEAHMVPPGTRETRDLLRSRLVLVTRAGRCHRSIGALLETYTVGSPDGLPELPRLQAALQAEQEALLKAHIRRIEHELRDRVLATPDAQRLVWIPGIGKMVAYTLLLEIDAIRRFPTVRRFHSYCRLVPGWYPARTIPAASAAISAPGTGIGTSKSPFIMPRSGRSRPSTKSAPNIADSSGARAKPLPEP